MTQTMQNKPCRLLGNAQITSERRGRNPLGVVGKEPDCPKPYPERQFRILEDRANQDREIGSALRAPINVLALKRINLVMAAVRAKLAVTPPDALKMAKSHLIVTESVI
jgi:hypothetical protein